MAKKIQAWTEFRPRLESTNPMTSKELIENIIAATNQSRGSVQAVLSELDVQIESALKSGRIVQLPNSTHYQPIGKKDGSVNIKVRVNPELDKRINAEFRGKWINSANIGKSEEEIIALWNEAHPEDPIEV
jgi:nucleoid DNA-binding protein